MQVEKLAIDGLVLVTPRKFGDARGFFSETFNAHLFGEHGISEIFVQDNHSVSALKGTVRGLHFQTPPHAQGKLVRVVRGSILDVAADLRRSSSTFGRHVAVELSASNWRQLYVPPGFAHGFCTLEPDTEVIYKVTDYFAPQSDAGIRWDDPALGIKWPDFAGASLSAKDTALPMLSQINSLFY